MDINKIIKTLRNLNEGVPTNSTGSSIDNYDKFLFPIDDDDLSQDYQTPGQSGMAKWRFSNVYPVQKLTDQDIDNMVDASKEFVQMQDENTEQRVKKNFSSFMEDAPVNNASGGAIAGLPPDNPPVSTRAKKKYIKLGRGSRKWWMPKTNGKE
tara:strand:+ start:1300 stop:1758 length:459 start_codon:yes stop_codon:yes gene_type:complete